MQSFSVFPGIYGRLQYLHNDITDQLGTLLRLYDVYTGIIHLALHDSQNKIHKLQSIKYLHYRLKLYEKRYMFNHFAYLVGNQLEMFAKSNDCPIEAFNIFSRPDFGPDCEATINLSKTI